MADPLFMYKLKNGLLGTPDNYGGLLSPEQSQANQNAGLMNFGATLLQAGGPSRTPVSLGQALGQASLAGQAGRAQADQQSLQGVLIKKQIAQLGQKNNPFGNINPSDFTSESLSEFQKSGNYGDLKLRSTKNFGNVNPGDFTPESLAKYSLTGNYADLQRYVTPANPTVQVVNGVPTVVTPSRTGETPKQAPLTTLTAEEEAKRRLAAAGELGKGAGEIAVGKEKKASNADTVGKQLDIAEPLLDIATGSTVGNAADKAAAFFGFAPDGATATAQLKVIQATLIQNMPRLEGPQSDKDTQLYREAAGQIADPNVPVAIRKAALQTIRRINNQYKAGDSKSSAPEMRTWEEGGYMFRQLPDGTVQRKKK